MKPPSTAASHCPKRRQPANKSCRQDCQIFTEKNNLVDFLVRFSPQKELDQSLPCFDLVEVLLLRGNCFFESQVLRLLRVVQRRQLLHLLLIEKFGCQSLRIKDGCQSLRINDLIKDQESRIKIQYQAPLDIMAKGAGSRIGITYQGQRFSSSPANDMRCDEQPGGEEAVSAVLPPHFVTRPPPPDTELNFPFL